MRKPLKPAIVLALQTGDVSPDGRVITVRRGLWRNQVLDKPKTPSGNREVDVPEPLATLLAGYVAGRTGFVFATATGKPLNQRNALRALHSVKKVGFHALRRFRAERLAEAGVPDLLSRWWMGHSAKDLSAMYAMGFTQKADWRREWCDKAGLGFYLGYMGYKSRSEIESVKAAVVHSSRTFTRTILELMHFTLFWLASIGLCIRVFPYATLVNAENREGVINPARIGTHFQIQEAPPAQIPPWFFVYTYSSLIAEKRASG